jgi:hypothetical protein
MRAITFYNESLLVIVILKRLLSILLKYSHLKLNVVSNENIGRSLALTINPQPAGAAVLQPAGWHRRE